MKHIAALICLLLTTLTSPAFALQGNDCAARGEKIKPAEREEFMKSCLAQAESPANVKEAQHKHKSALCEQNAKNKKLQGNEKANYQANCMNKNEAVAVASAQPAAPSHKAASSSSSKSSKPKSTPHKTAERKQKEHKKGSKKDEKQTASAASVSIEGL